jgi:hypothetical protein
MNRESTIGKTLGALVMLLTVAVPAYVAYDIYGRGPIPEKRLQLNQLTPINPLRDLSGLGARASFSLQLENQKLNNITIATTWITNIGGIPILPGDFYEKLSVTVDKPWKIVAVENRTGFLPEELTVNWKRRTDTTFEAEPLLLNPGDSIWMNVYVTDPEFSGSAPTKLDPNQPAIHWKVRIANLRGFSAPADPFADSDYGLEVRLSGWGVPFTLISTALFLALYIHLLSQAGILKSWTWPSIALVACASLLAVSAAEGCAAYIFPTQLTRLLGVQDWLNVSIIWST